MWTCFWLRLIKRFIQFVLCHESVPDFMTVNERGKKRKLTQAGLENRKQKTNKQTKFKI